MTENLIETIRATVQDFLAPEIRTHTVRLEALDHKIEETKQTLVAKIEAVDHKVDEAKQTLVAKIEAVAGSVEETKQTLRADIRTVEVRLENLAGRLDDRMKGFQGRMDDRFHGVETRIQSLESLIQQLIRQVSVEGSLRERIASLEARVSQH